MKANRNGRNTESTTISHTRIDLVKTVEEAVLADVTATTNVASLLSSMEIPETFPEPINDSSSTDDEDDADEDELLDSGASSSLVTLPYSTLATVDIIET